MWNTLINAGLGAGLGYALGGEKGALMGGLGGGLAGYNNLGFDTSNGMGFDALTNSNNWNFSLGGQKVTNPSQLAVDGGVSYGDAALSDGLFGNVNSGAGNQLATQGGGVSYGGATVTPQLVSPETIGGGLGGLKLPDFLTNKDALENISTAMDTYGAYQQAQAQKDYMDFLIGKGKRAEDRLNQTQAGLTTGFGQSSLGGNYYTS